MTRTACKVAIMVWAGCLLLARLDAGEAASDQPQPQIASGQNAGEVLVVVGAAGGENYRVKFATWADRWRKGAKAGGCVFRQIGGTEQSHDPTNAASDRESLQAVLSQLDDSAATPFWLVLIGHGTFDGRSAKFNLEGPDISVEDLADWLPPSRRTAVICCQSASGPFLEGLTQPNRIVISATKNGHEQNFARFGDYFSQRVADPEADLDKDGQTSLLEAFLKAARDTAAFYRDSGRLATEHALLEDNGDGTTVRADDFRGIRLIDDESAEHVPDGQRAHQLHLVPNRRERRLTAAQRQRRDAIEQAVFAHRRQRSNFSEEEYLAKLEALLLPLARLYADVDRTVLRKGGEPATNLSPSDPAGTVSSSFVAAEANRPPSVARRP